MSRLLKVVVEPADAEVLVRVTGTRSPDFTSFTLHEPHRVILDWAGSTVDGALPEQMFDGGLVRKITTRQFNSEAERISRITIEIARQTTYRVETDGHRVLVRFANVAVPAPEPVVTDDAAEGEASEAESRPALMATLLEQELPAGPLTEPAEPPPPPPAVAAPTDVVHLASNDGQAADQAERAPAPPPLVETPPAAPEPKVAPPAVRLASSAPPAPAAPPPAPAAPPPAPAAPPASVEAAADAPAVVAQPTPEPVPDVREVPLPPKFASDHDPGNRIMKYVGFRLKGQKSLVFVKCDGKARYEVTKADGRIFLDLFDTRIVLKNNQNALDTSYFPSAVTRVQASPTPTGTRVEVELRDDVPFEVRRFGSQIQLLFDPP